MKKLIHKCYDHHNDSFLLELSRKLMIVFGQDFNKIKVIDSEKSAKKDENTAIENNQNFSSWRDLKQRRKRNFSDSNASTNTSDISIPELVDHQNNVYKRVLGIDHEVRQKIDYISLAEELPKEMMQKYKEFCCMNSDFGTTPPASPLSNQSGKKSPLALTQIDSNELETPFTSYDGQPAAKKQKLVDKFSKDLICTICYELFINPVGLKCGHLFCNFCLIQCMKSKKDCPSCRKPIPEKPNKQVSVPTTQELH